MSLGADFRQALRLFARQPGFTATAVLVLALGIGANSAVFTLVNALLLQPRPGQGSERVVGVYSRNRVRPDTYRAFSYPAFTDIRDRNDAFEQVMAHSVSLMGVTEGDITRRVFGAVVSANYFETLGVPLARGRAFAPAEEHPGAGIPVVILGDAFWRRRGADPGILGQTVTINGQACTVIGVTPRGFTGTSSLISPEVYLPLGMYETVVDAMFRRGRDTRLADRRHDALMLVGRLRPGLTPQAVMPALDRLARQLESAYPAEMKDQTFFVQRLPRMSISTSPGDDGEMATVSVLLMGMAGCVLLIACLNIANMLLARGTARRKEIAIRQAIGGNRARIVRQLLVEGCALSGAGALGGLALAYWTTRLLVSSMASAFPISIEFDPAPDARVLLATLGFAVAGTLAFGLGPAWALSRADVVTDLRDQSSEPAPRTRSRLLAPKHLLVTAQVALSLVLLTTGGLFVRSALQAARAEPGYPLDRGVMANVDPGLGGASEIEGRETYRALLHRVRALPGVETASLASNMAFSDMTESRRVWAAERSPGAGEVDPASQAEAIEFVIGTAFFKTLGLTVLQGRDFTEAEEQSGRASQVVIVDEPLARRLWPGQNPIGLRLARRASQEGAPPDVYEVVGLVPGIKHDLFDRQPVAHIYLPFGSSYRGNMIVHARGARGGTEAARALLHAMRAEIRAVDARLPVIRIGTLADHREASVMMWAVRTGGRLFVTFGLVALTLAIVGLYGVKAYLVARRTREIGIRMALGATDRQVQRMVLRDGLTMTAVGAVIGMALSAVAGRVVAGMLYNVSPLDPATFVLTPVVLLSTALVACYVPARRAARVSPIIALRES